MDFFHRGGLILASAGLENRTVLRVAGDDAEHFLQNLLTCDVEVLKTGEATFGGLLTPQGKILFDFVIFQEEGGFLVDVSSTQAADLLKRLAFYRLRAAVTLEQTDLPVSVAWDGEDLTDAFPDPRGGDVVRAFTRVETMGDWTAKRIALGWPECGADYAPETTFPHEALFDQFSGGGVAFEKGCYVGQEVVSRMQHRGTARSRFVQMKGDSDLPEMCTEVLAADRKIGTLGSSAGSSGLALVRLDRLAKAKAEGTPVTAAGIALSADLPPFVTFNWPDAQDG